TAAAKALEDARRNAEERQQEQEKLTWQLTELEQLNLKDGEWDAINTEYNRLAHAQSLLDGVNAASSALDADEGSALQALNAAANQIRQLVRHDANLQSIYDS